MNAEQQKLERFSAGELFAVDPDAIERELAALWREAGQSSGDQRPVTRACLWNVVVHLEERAGEGHGQASRLAEMISELPGHLAARALVLRTRDEQRELESWISANCILAGDGSKLVCSEEITIAANEVGERHLPGLVRALLVPAVPTAAVFGAVPPSGALEQVTKLADRIVTNVDATETEDPLGRVAELAKEAPLMAMDIGWLQDAPLRAHIAELFDPPNTVEALGGITKVHYAAPPSQRWTSRLMLGWIGSALGEKTSLSLELDERLAGPRIEFVAGERAEPIVFEAVEPKVCEAPTPTGGRVRKSLAAPRGAAILARALATRAEDRSFAHALAAGRKL